MSEETTPRTFTGEGQPAKPEMIIKVNEVTRIYPIGESQVMALRDAALDVPKGVLGALTGRSG
ncbi:MAG: ABC transporter ATP-binding protein, partial [Chloroflexi bacterium]